MAKHTFISFEIALGCWSTAYLFLQSLSNEMYASSLRKVCISEPERVEFLHCTIW